MVSNFIAINLLRRKDKTVKFSLLGLMNIDPDLNILTKNAVVQNFS